MGCSSSKDREDGNIAPAAPEPRRREASLETPAKDVVNPLLGVAPGAGDSCQSGSVPGASSSGGPDSAAEIASAGGAKAEATRPDGHLNRSMSNSGSTGSAPLFRVAFTESQPTSSTAVPRRPLPRPPAAHMGASHSGGRSVTTGGSSMSTASFVAAPIPLLNGSVTAASRFNASSSGSAHGNSSSAHLLSMPLGGSSGGLGRSIVNGGGGVAGAGLVHSNRASMFTPSTANDKPEAGGAAGQPPVPPAPQRASLKADVAETELCEHFETMIENLDGHTPELSPVGERVTTPPQWIADMA